MADKKYELMAWYFPNWHPDARNDAWHGKGWTEWEVTKCARPRFEGHDQPKVPLWGYADESDPKVMELKIRTAREYGITGFFWDMYWFEDGGYRLDALNKGFFGAKNNEDMKIALMWCNHDPIYAHPATRRRPHDPLLSGELSAEGFCRGTDYFIENYFWRNNYLRVDGKVYFIIYNPKMLVSGLGGIPETRAVLDDFRERVRKAGLGELYLAFQLTNCPAYAQKDRAGLNEYVRALGFDGALRYSWPTRSDKFPREEYKEYIDDGIATFAGDTAMCDFPMNLTVSNGWDCSPRTLQSEIYENVGYPWTVVTVNRSADEYERALRAAKVFADSDRFTGDFITLSTWNEWTEGNYLEPDTKFGYEFLERIKRVFG